MTCTSDRSLDAALRCSLSPCRKFVDDDENIDRIDRPVRSRGHDFDDDDPYDPPDDDDEDYESFQWEEVPDDGDALPPDERWDDDDWD